MSKSSLNLSIGAVELNVADLDLMRSFYHKVLGLDILKETPIRTELGANKKPLIILHHRVDLSHPHSGHAGLYHFAILYSSQGDLARAVYQVLKSTPQLFSGSADHLVSEAFYFNDPEGNGIELYYDRDRSLWQWENGQVRMATNYIDPANYLEQHLEKHDPESHSQMGHVHLKVGDIAKARQFYVDVLGFDVTAEMPSALFISVGGYHHHIGMNTWESSGAEKRTETHGLKNIEFILPTQSDFDHLKHRLEKHTIPFQSENKAITFADPWNNSIRARII